MILPPPTTIASSIPVDLVTSFISWAKIRINAGSMPYSRSPAICSPDSFSNRRFGALTLSATYLLYLFTSTLKILTDRLWQDFAKLQQYGCQYGDADSGPD